MNYYDAQQQNNGYFNRNNFSLGANNGGWYGQQPIMQEPPIIVIPINGEQAAKTYPIEKGRTVLFMDFENHRFYIKSIKPNGLESSCDGYSFLSDAEANMQRNQTQQTQQTIQMSDDFQNRFVSREEFEVLKKSIEDLIK